MITKSIKGLINNEVFNIYFLILWDKKIFCVKNTKIRKINNSHCINILYNNVEIYVFSITKNH